MTLNQWIAITVIAYFLLMAGMVAVSLPFSEDE